MIKYTVRCKLQSIAETWAVNQWEEFLDHPEYLGPSFRWQHYPRFVGRSVLTGIFMAFKRKLTEKEARYASACAIRKARTLVKHMKKIRSLGTF